MSRKSSLYRKYSKDSGFYLSTKKTFFDENASLLNNALRQNELYGSQPQRDFCKLCRSELPGAIDFRSHGIDYSFCTTCSHLNGRHEDTESFTNELYLSGDGKDYFVNYSDENFEKRTTDIYLPKLDFLLKSLPSGPFKILDVGCGSGYLVYAAFLRGVEATGVDVGRSAVEFGNSHMEKRLNLSPLLAKSEDGFYEMIVNSAAEVVSAIGVIEHLRSPHRLFEAFKRSDAQYLFYSVPMCSFSIALENIFPSVFPRQLSGGHTHLFTERSLVAMNNIIGIEPLAEWRFGTDVLDLYRSLRVRLEATGSSEVLLDHLNEGLVTIIDELQAVFDRNHYCSEIHCVASKL